MLTPIRIKPWRALAVLTFPVWGFLLMLALFVAMVDDFGNLVIVAYCLRKGMQ